MQRLAAWRTRLSSQGEPCGEGELPGPDMRLRVLVDREAALLDLRARRPGAGASIQSTWPESSAAVRAFASGSGSSTTLSILGRRFSSQ